jgi:DNA-damage-inducible protein J
MGRGNSKHVRRQSKFRSGGLDRGDTRGYIVASKSGEAAMAADTVVRARIDTATKEEATEALAAMGLSVSDAIRLLLVRIAADKTFPFTVKTPNATTRKALAQLEKGKGKRFASADELFKDLDI